MRGEIQTEPIQKFEYAELVKGILSNIDNRSKTITLALGTSDDVTGNFTPAIDSSDGRQYTETIETPGMTVNPKHLGTYYELRVIDGVLDPTHNLD